MAEAVVRVQRAAGDIGRQIEGLRRNTQAALAELAQVDPQVARAIQALERYQEQLRKGQKFTSDEAATYQSLNAYVQRRAAEAQKPPAPAQPTPERPTAPTPAPPVPKSETAAVDADRVRMETVPARPAAAPVPPVQQVFHVQQEAETPPAQKAQESREAEPGLFPAAAPQPAPSSVSIPSEAPELAPMPEATAPPAPRAEPAEEAGPAEPGLFPSAPARRTAPVAEPEPRPVNEPEHTPTQPAPPVPEDAEAEAAVPSPRHTVEESGPAEPSLPWFAPPPVPPTPAAPQADERVEGLSESELAELAVDVDRRRRQVDADLDREATRAYGGEASRDKENYRARLADADPVFVAVRAEQEKVRAEQERRRAKPEAAEPTPAPEETPEAPLVPRTPGELSDDERAHMRELGYSDDDLARTVIPATGPLIIPPPSPVPRQPPPERLAPMRPASAPQLRPAEEGRRAEGGDASDTPRVEATDGVDPGDVTDVTREVDDQAAAWAKLRREKQLQGISDRELRREWKGMLVDLNALSRELQKLERRRDHGGDPGKMAELDERIGDVREGLRGIEERRAEMTAEWERRGGHVDADTMVEGEAQAAGGGMGRPPGWGELLTTFAGGAGFGGGGFTGPVLSVLAGMMHPARAAALIAGYTVGSTLGQGSRAFGLEVDALRTAIPTTAALGDNNAYARIGEATRLSKITGMYRPGEILAVERALARGTGRVAETGQVVQTAQVTGSSPDEEANRVVALSRMAPRIPRALSASLLAAYGVSSVPEPAAGPLGMTTAFYGDFAQAVAQAMNQYNTPYTRTPIEDVAAQLSSMTNIEAPGVDPHSPAAIDVAQARLKDLNQFTAGMIDNQGVLGDLSYFAVRELRGSKVAERLRRPDIGIDIDTPLGVYRAARRAPQLAAMGIPDVAEAINQRFQEAFPDQGLRELVALQQTHDPEAAAFLASGKGVDVYRAKPVMAGEEAAPMIEKAASDLAQSKPVRDVFEQDVKSDVIRLNSAELQSIGFAQAEMWNKFLEVFSSTLERLWHEESPRNYPGLQTPMQPVQP